MKVLIPDVLQSYTRAKEVDANGSTVMEVFDDLEDQFPGMRFRVINELDKLRPNFKLFINGELTRELSALIGATDELFIMQSLSGG